MMNEDIFKVFDYWGTIQKARKAKGLAKWDKLAHIAGKLKGKKSSDIEFICSHPSHGDKGKKHTLGSIEGNTHILLGYCNPAFHFAVYHWQILDPNLTEEDALVLQKTKGHPSRPELWERSGLDMEDEGDLIDGFPHPSVAVVREMLKVKRAKKAESITVASGIGSYTAIPSEGIVYGNHNNQTYAWEMVKDSFFAAANLDLTEKMNEAAEDRQVTELEITKSLEISELVKHVAFKYNEKEFDDTVYSLVKSHFPKPSSIIPVESVSGETLYGIVTSNAINFYDREGCAVNISIYDLPMTSFDLVKGGAIYASVLHSFGARYLGISDELNEFVQEEVAISVPTTVLGSPTPGFDHLEGTYEELLNVNKTVVIEEDNTVRLIVQ